MIKLPNGKVFKVSDKVRCCSRKAKIPFKLQLTVTRADFIDGEGSLSFEEIKSIYFKADWFINLTKEELGETNETF